MELWEQLLMAARRKKFRRCTAFSEETVKEILESSCYKLLTRIREILDDDTLEDKSCFMKIEAIVCAYESFGSNGGGRHDF